MNEKIKLDNEKIKKLFTEKGFTTSQLADVFDVTPQTIRRRLKDMGVNVRDYSALKRDEYGRILGNFPAKEEPLTYENHGRYINGKSIYRRRAFDEYNFTEECFHCKSTENIIVHHLDHNRENNEKENLRPVCRSCHLKIEHPEVLEKMIKGAQAYHLRRRQEKENNQKEA